MNTLYHFLIQKIINSFINIELYTIDIFTHIHTYPSLSKKVKVRDSLLPILKVFFRPFEPSMTSTNAKQTTISILVPSPVL